MLSKLNLLKNIKLFDKKNIIFILLSLFVYLFSRSFNWLLLFWVTYNVMFNNSVQTIGLFLSSNKNSFINWLFFSSIFLVSIFISWFFNNGEVHYGLLNNIEYNDNISYLMIFLPILLYFLTKKRIPVSATFLIIPLFADKEAISYMVNKTSVSYLFSLIFSFMIYNFLYKKFSSFIKNKNVNFPKVWFFLEYLSTGILWFSWLKMVLSNFVIFVPRKFDYLDLFILSIIGILTIYVIIFSNGGNIQKIVEQKSDTKNIKTVVIFNLLFSFMLLFTQFISSIPITSTWMFLGILAGREFAIAINNRNILTINLKYKTCLLKIWKDLSSSMFGVLISLIFVYVLRFFI